MNEWERGELEEYHRAMESDTSEYVNQPIEEHVCNDDCHYGGERAQHWGHGCSLDGSTWDDEPDLPRPLPEGQLRVRRWVEAGQFNLVVDNAGGPIAEHVLLAVLPRVVELFLQKARDYTREDGVNWAEILGEKAQFVDIFRKVGKLYNAMWEGKELKGEPVEEILMDLVGHALLILEERTRKCPLPLETS